MTDEERCVGEDAAPGDVIIMVVAIDHIADGLIGQSLDLRLQPGCRLGTDWIGDDDAVWRGDENRLMEFMPEQVHVLG